MTTATLVASDIPGWAPGTNLYATDDGRHLAVEAMPLPEGTTQVIEVGQDPMSDNILAQVGDTFASIKVVLRPTVIFLCAEDGTPLDADENDYDPLTPLHTFDPGTSHEDAVRQAGYDIA